MFPSLGDTDEKFDHDYILILKPPKNQRIDQLIVRKITKMQQNVFGGRAPARPAGGAWALPQTH